MRPHTQSRAHATESALLTWMKHSTVPATLGPATYQFPVMSPYASQSSVVAVDAATRRMGSASGSMLVSAYRMPASGDAYLREGRVRRARGREPLLLAPAPPPRGTSSHDD